jgi:HTH-type transcriptional regulator/antitoxin HipB
VHVRSSRDLGALARDRRQEIGWSQTELAGRIGTSRSWVSEMENGKERVEVSLVLKALHALGLIVDVRARAVEPGYAPEPLAPLPPRRATVAGGRPALTRGGKSLSAARAVHRRGGPGAP